MPADESNLAQVALTLGVVGAAPHRQAERTVRPQPRPHQLRVEALVAQVDHLGGSSCEVEERLGDPTARDRLVAAVCLRVRLLDEARPQLLLPRRGATAAERESRVERQLRATRRRRHGEQVVDPHRLPRAIEEQAQAVAARIVAGGVGEEPRDQIVPLGDNCQRRHEPAVAHATLPEVVRTEPVVTDNVELTRESRPL